MNEQEEWLQGRSALVNIRRPNRIFNVVLQYYLPTFVNAFAFLTI